MYCLNCSLKTLGDAGLTNLLTVFELDLTPRQVRHAALASKISPVKAMGRPPVLIKEQVGENEKSVSSSLINRQMKNLELAMGPFQSFRAIECMIRSELRKRNSTRCMARCKPSMSKYN